MRTNFVLILNIILLTSIISCKKGDDSIHNSVDDTKSRNFETIEGVNYYYYVDNVESELANFQPSLENDNLIIITDNADGEDITDIFIHEFTNEADYIQFGIDNNIKIQELVNFENQIRSYIDYCGISSSLDSLVSLPEWYLEEELSIYFDNFGQNKSPNFVPGATLHRNMGGGEPAYHMLSTMAVMFAWDNTVSTTFPTYYTGGHTLYDKKWYKTKLATLAGWGWRFYKFDGPLAYLNDKMSSGVSWQ